MVVGMKAVAALADCVMGCLDAGLGLLYPQVCQLCHAARATPVEGFVCAACRAKVQFIQRPFCERCGRPYEGLITMPFLCPQCLETPPHFARARAAVVANELVLEVIHRYKYTRALWLEPFLAGLLIAQAQPELAKEPWNLIVPVPLYPAKQREREFNQAERLARRLSQATHIPLNHRLIRRVRPTCTQTFLKRPERLTNVRAAFALRRHHPLIGERIVLLDDVLTTGATTNACAEVLIAAGAAEVCVWTVARGI
jgi:competence protein ComFC